MRAGRVVRAARPRLLPGLPAALLAALLAAGCAGPSAQAPVGLPGPVEEPAVTFQPAIHWTRTAAEHHALFRQGYAWATERVEAAAAGREPGSWAVIVDADETLLDNSTYQSRRAALDMGYSPESWTRWVMEEAAPALPGAVAFTERVRALGGQVAVVTNRAEHECDATRRNLAAVGVEAAVVLCRSPGERGKEGRFRKVLDGTTPAGLPPLEVVAWVGDNIQDFPGGTQAGAADEALLSQFGARFFLLPNPMYGSWEDNPVR